MTSTQTTIDRAVRLIRAATGDDYGDGLTVMDMGVGIVDGDPDAVWVTGNWNDDRKHDPATGQWITTDDTASRLAAALERIGAEPWWYDTCSQCSECWRLIDTEVMFGTAPSIWVDGHGDTCLECVEKDVNDYLDEYINDPSKALPSQLDADVVAAAGWERLDEDYRSGWYGREDQPDEILAAVLAEAGEDAEVVFQVTSAHMFELSFVVWLRVPEQE